MPKIKYGQIGVGHAHASKIQVYRGSDDYEVVGVVEPDESLRAQASKDPAYRDLPWMTHEQLLNSPGLQLVGVETRVRDLLENAAICIDAGVHVHLDKPAGASLPRYRQILDDAAKKHLTVQMGYMYRYNPAIVFLRKALKQGWLGEPFEVHTVISKKSDAEARREFAEYPGGTMFELGCHVIDLVHGVLGEPERIQPFARHSANVDDQLLDNMLAVFEYPRATATVRSSVNEIDGFARRHFVVCGSEGTMHIQPMETPVAQLALSRERDQYRKGYQQITFPPFVRYVEDAADMVKIIRHEKDADFSYDYDYAVQRSVLLASGVS